MTSSLVGLLVHLPQLDRYRRPSTNEGLQSPATSTPTGGASESRPRDRDVQPKDKRSESNTREDWDRLHDINMTGDEPPSITERPNGMHWKSNERDVPSWLEGMYISLLPP